MCVWEDGCMWTCNDQKPLATIFPNKTRTYTVYAQWYDFICDCICEKPKRNETN